jgi:hypothetical protein
MSRSSGTRCRTRARRGCRTRPFGAAGLDWRYSAFDIEDPVAAVRALATLGFAGNCGIAVRVTRALLGI